MSALFVLALLGCPGSKESCPAGTEGESGDCEPCNPGEYDDPDDTLGCLPCDEDGEVSTEEGATACERCPLGTRNNLDHTDCTPCPAGTVEDGEDCVPCAPNTYSLEGGLECTSCPAGTVIDLDDLECDPCPAGTYSDPDDEPGCQPCDDPGTFSEEGAAFCSLCPPGSAPAADRGSCASCEPGTFSDDGEDCLPCPVNTTSEDGAEVCFSCPAGSEVSSDPDGGCVLCPPGTHAGPSDEPGCQPCDDAAEYASEEGQEFCSFCAPGTKPTADHTACEICPEETFGTGQTCALCPEGTTAAAGSEVCDPCPEGAVALGEGLGCVACPLGSTFDPVLGDCVELPDVDAPCHTVPAPIRRAGSISWDVLYDEVGDTWVVGAGAEGVDRVDPVDFTVDRLADAPGGFEVKRVTRWGDRVLAAREVSFAAPSDGFLDAPLDPGSPAAAVFHHLPAIAGIGTATPVWAYDVVPVGADQLAYVDLYRVEVVRLDTSAASWTLLDAFTPDPHPFAMQRFVGEGDVAWLISLDASSITTVIAVDTSSPAPWADRFATRLGTWTLPAFPFGATWDPDSRTLYVATEANTAYPEALTGLVAISLDDPTAEPVWQAAEPDEPQDLDMVLSRPVLVDGVVALVTQGSDRKVRATLFEPGTLRRLGYVRTGERVGNPSPGFQTAAATAARSGEIYVAGGYSFDEDFVVDVGVCTAP